MKFFTRNQDSRWITLGGLFCNFETTTKPAPYLRQEFTCDSPAAGAKVAICGLGYYELFINGKRVGDHVLDPVVSRFDKHVRYVVHDVSKYLKKGRNAIGVVLGTGWYNCHTPGMWVLEKACWRDVPKMRLELRDAKGKLLVASDEKWKATNEGPIVFDGLRNGETYDARKDFNGDFSKVKFDDSNWKSAWYIRPPGGLLEEQTCVPIRIVDTQELTVKTKKGVYDLGRNIAGHARITVKGEAGAKVTLEYAERINKDGSLSKAEQQFANFLEDRWQTDEYILKGAADGETWEPCFTYHGFQYVKVTIEGKAKLQKIEARIVNTDFDEVGSFESGNAMINTLQTLTRRSYLANFVGIPTDCPHREKNGWTGDAQLASETGLCNFDAAPSYRQWIATMRDCQLADGNLPGIVPTGGWGFNWGNGPAWDSALFVIPWNVYLYTGDTAILKENYESMKRYLDHADAMAVDGITQFGLGDWCSDPAKMVDERLTNTAIRYSLLIMAADIADLLKVPADAAKFRKDAAFVKKAFHKAFYKGKGIYAEGELTAMGAALYFGLCPNEAIRKATIKRLAECVEGCGATAQFGIIGAKVVPRVLADNGYAELAAKFFTQEEFPGWAHWVIADNATSLHEIWSTGASWNHIMFGDLSAWCFKYPGGFRFSAAKPGYKNLTIQPEIIREWGSFKAQHRGYITEWQYNKKDDTVFIRVTVPEGCKAEVILPCGCKKSCKPGIYEFIDIPMP